MKFSSSALRVALATTLLLFMFVSPTSAQAQTSSAETTSDAPFVIVPGAVDPPTAAQSVLCHDGRDWTSEQLVDGECVVTNLCSPEEIALSTEEEPDVPAVLRWTWVFPDTCPMHAVDVVGTLVEHRVAQDPSGDLTLGTAIITSDAGITTPSRVGGSTLEITCGYVALEFTVLAESDLVATATGSTFTGECPASETTPPTPALLEEYTSSSGPVGALARLYWVVFGRVPDRAGLGYWAARTNAGLDLDGVASIWTGLPEWEATYGGTSDDEFLNLVYQNVLGRAPDQGGYDYWLGRLADDLSRERLAVLFSDATEFRDRTETR